MGYYMPTKCQVGDPLVRGVLYRSGVLYASRYGMFPNLIVSICPMAKDRSEVLMSGLW